MEVARKLVICALGTLALGAVPACAAAGGGGSAAAPHVTATVSACHAAVAQADRFATFDATMTATSQTRTMGERFELQQNAGAGFHDLATPGSFGAWQISAPGVTLLDDTQTVSGLLAPAAFRVIVHYRWLDSHRHVLRTATRTTPACRMPDERPNLVLRSIVVLSPTQYAVTVRNAGLGPAGPFQVALGVGATQLTPLPLTGLASHASATLRFTGPACTAGQSLTAVADPARTVNETTTADNTKTASC